jgi:hypothetical protein
MAYLTKTQFCSQRTTSRHSLVIITNWGSYQGGEAGDIERATNRQPADNQPTTTPEERKKSSSKKTKKKDPAGSPHTEQGSGSRSKPDDDQKPQPVYASDKEELIALIRTATGAMPDRRLVRDICEFLELRGGTLRVYLDYIRPRLGRLTNPPTAAFFYRQAKEWGAAGLQPAPEPRVAVAEPQPAGPRCPRCGLSPGKGMVLEGDRVVPCPICAAAPGPEVSGPAAQPEEPQSVPVSCVPEPGASPSPRNTKGGDQ